MLLLTSCSDNISFTSKEIEQNSTDCENECASVYLNYLECKKPEGFANNYNKIIENRILDFVLSNQTDTLIKDKTIEEAIGLFMKEYEDLKITFGQAPPYELMLNDSVVFQNKKMVSLVSNTYSYLGGAHGYASTVFLNFDIKNGQLIPFKSLFSNVEEITKIAEKHFKKSQSIEETDNINSEGYWFEDNVFHLPESIGFSKDTMILQYNPYEIAAYANGAIVINIPIDEVKPYLNYWND